VENAPVDNVRVEILDEGLAKATAPILERLVADGVASRLTARDPTLWGRDAEHEASSRLAWTNLNRSSRPLLADLEALRTELRDDGVDRVVLAGMGGSSLAPEVICASAAAPLVVLDTTDPGQISDALAGDLSRTVLVVSSKSGTTVETDSQRRTFERAFAEAGLEAASHMVVVTDPGSPLDELGHEAGYRSVFLADPNVGGRYSALTAFGLVPAALAGIDVRALLDEAAAAARVLALDDQRNPALRLAAALGAAATGGAEKVVLADTGSGAPGFGDWAEQLIAESTGKRGTGLLPVAVEGPDAPGFADAGPDATPVAVGAAAGGATVCTSGRLGGLLLLWEYAVAIVGRLLGINPFDQPDVEAAKAAARALLDQVDAGRGGAAPRFTDGPIEVRADGDWLGADVVDVAGALRALVAAAPERGYLAVQAYLDRIHDASAAVLRPELARRSADARPGPGGLQTTFGWGPRFLHSTGQYHKGGHQNGVFLQVTGDVAEDLPIPARPYTFGILQRAQALGDAQVLVERGRPVLRCHLIDRVAGLAALARAAQEVAG